MRISDWSDVCSSDLLPDLFQEKGNVGMALAVFPDLEVEGAGADLAVFGRGRVVAQQRVVHRMVDRVDAEAVHAAVQPERSAERRVGKECVSTGRSRWSP